MIVAGITGCIIAFILLIWLLVKEHNHKAKIIKLKSEYEAKLVSERSKAVQKSKDVTRGHISQEFIPIFPDFPYNMSDCKFSGNPLDFLVFKGMSDLRDGKESEIEIIFADVKTNKAKRNKIQNAIKKAIESNKVRFETWTVLENKQIKIN